MTLALWILGAYLLGSIPTSYLLSRYAARVDLRQLGSKNLGATNVYRVLGWRYAVPVALVDIAKGALPVLLVVPRAGGREWLPVVVGGAAVVGHVFSVFMRFQGGKGVATAAGVVLGLAPAALGVSAVVWILVVSATGYVSLASMLGAITFPVAVAVLGASSNLVLWIGIALAAFIVYTHRSNLRRLAAGRENRFGHGRRTTGKDG